MKKNLNNLNIIHNTVILEKQVIIKTIFNFI